MLDHVLTAARSAVWLIRRDKLDTIFALLESRASGVQADAATLKAFAADTRRRAGASSAPGAVGVLPVLGTIVQRGNLFTEASGTASTETLAKQFDALLNNDQVGTILLDVDSPGGTVYGVPELSAKIAAARGRKPIVAIANAEAASAAFWIASAADEVVVTPSGAVGSVGAYVRHDDLSGINETLGIRSSYIAYGEYKTEGNPDEPLTDEARAELQRVVDHYGSWFERDLAANRQLPLSQVKSDFGQGRMVEATDAVKRGMADKVASFEDTVSRLLSDKPRIKRLARAERLLRIL